MIVEILKMAMSGFWSFIGVGLLASGVLMLLYGTLELLIQFCMRAYHVRVRHRTIRKVGYPPEHCDTDGDPVQHEIGMNGLKGEHD